MQNIKIDEISYLTLKDASVLLKITIDALVKRVERGRITSCKRIGKSILIPEKYVYDCLERKI